MNLLNLPKIELHCHLDGSLRVETAIELAKKEGVDIFAYNCKVTEEEIELLNPVEIVL